MGTSREKVKGRREDGARSKFVKLEHWVMDTAAWRDLDTVARCAYVEIRRSYFGTNNGRIGIGIRHLADNLKVSKATAARALTSLQDHGFIVAMTKGSFNRKVRHSTEYRITEEGCDVTQSLATKDFARWQKNTVPLVRLSVPVVRPIGPSGETEAPREGAKNPPHGPSGETVTGSLGPSGETHVCLPSTASASTASRASRASSGKRPKSSSTQTRRALA